MLSTLLTRQIEAEAYAPARLRKSTSHITAAWLFGIRCREEFKISRIVAGLVSMCLIYLVACSQYCIRAKRWSKAGRINSADSEVNQVHVVTGCEVKADPSNNVWGMLGQCLTGGYVIQMSSVSICLQVSFIILWGFKGRRFQTTSLWMKFVILQGHCQMFIHSVLLNQAQQTDSATGWSGWKPIPITCRMVRKRQSRFTRSKGGR